MLLERINSVLWGPFMLIILSGTGLWFTIGTHFLQIRRFAEMFRRTLGGMLAKHSPQNGGVSPFAAMSTALASCLGTGNITGVAGAIIMGGPGALFWMWVTAFLSMATKYAEVALAVRFRKREDGCWSGGPMYYIEYGLGMRPLACIFAAVCVLATLGTGNLTQMGAMAGSLKSAFGVPPLLTGLVSAVLAGLVVFGGFKGVSGVSEKLVPFMSVLYVGGALIVLAFHAERLIPAVNAIFASAFGIQQAGAGAAGYAVARAMRYGAARGVFSNEAGMGSSPIAHAGAEAESPDAQGLWGAMEVFIDTLVMCTLTGLVILVSGVPVGQADGTALTGMAFSSVFDRAGQGFIAVSVSLFAITSVMGWSCYGEQGCVYLFGARRLPLLLYRAAYLCAVPLGAVMSMDSIWAVSDLLCGAMLLPNLTAVLLLSGKVFDMEKRGNIIFSTSSKYGVRY